jgi:hypothetical protein
MPIRKLVVIDPNPPKGSKTDVLVYQIPQNSRLEFLLKELCKKARIKFYDGRHSTKKKAAKK